MTGEALLTVSGLGKAYPSVRRLWGRAQHWALRDASFTLCAGRTLGVVGPSGSGKSTLARCVALLDAPSEGEIRMEGRDVTRLAGKMLRRERIPVQLLPQQPAAALNPRFTAEEIVAEPLRIRGVGSAEERRRRVAELMDLVALPAAACRRRALEFSGGERQRLAIARALALEPRLLILDESLTGLDLSVQAQIINLLLELQRRAGLAYIIVSHDLSVAANLADDVAVLDGGRVVEYSGAGELLTGARHPRTRELVDAAAKLSFRRGA
jgi:peptide/nickel transport system ATP-binding protein